MGRRRLLLGVASLLPAVCRGQACTANQWINRVPAQDDCIDAEVTPLLVENALWQYRCPIEGGVAADFGSGAEITAVGDSEATGSARGCAAACDQEALCEAFLWSDGISCTLFSSVISDTDTITPSAGTFYYRKNVGDANPGYLADGVSLPGTCGCPSAALPEDRCVVSCESSSDTTCVRVPDEQVDGGFTVLMKTGTGACRGVRSETDRADEDLTMYTVATPAECMALCTTPACYGVTIQTIADGIGDDVCETLPSAACELANTDRPTCEAASTADTTCAYDAEAGTCSATPATCEGLAAADCEAAPRCTLRSTPVDAFLCEVWDKVVLTRTGEKVRAAEVSSSDQYVPIIPRNQAADASGQCWIPQHVAQMCEVPAGSGTSAVTTGALANGVVAESCAAGELVPVGQQTCIVCDAFYGPDPDRTDAICNPRYEVDRAEWFQAGDARCKPECADNEEQLSECRQWASKDECNTNPEFMDMNCPLSCRTWLKENAYCIEPMDPNEAIMRCAACPSDYYDDEDPDEYLDRCASGNALDVPHCRAYGFSSRTQSMSPVARVYVENQGWRDMPLGADNDNEYLHRCEDMHIGPNFGQLGVPVPPNSIAAPDRYTVQCELKRKECTSYHRSSRDDCDEYYLTLRLNFFMDCPAFLDSGETPAEGCRASDNYVLDGKAGYPPRYCNRGTNDPEDPPHGFHWSIPLCKTTPECLVAGAAVLSDPDSLEVFQRDCCMLTAVADVEDGPDGSTTMRDLCSSATSGAARVMVPSWLRVVEAALAALMILSHTIW